MVRDRVEAQVPSATVMLLQPDLELLLLQLVVVAAVHAVLKQCVGIIGRVGAAAWAGEASS